MSVSMWSSLLLRTCKGGIGVDLFSGNSSTKYYKTEDHWEERGEGLPVSSFPGRPASCFWSLAVWRGKAWEKESRAWRQVRVDVRGAVPDHCNSQTLHWSALSVLYWHCLSNVIVSSYWKRHYSRTLRFFVGHPPPPPHVYSHISLSSQTLSHPHFSGGWEMV